MIGTLPIAISIVSAVVAIGVNVYVEYLDRKEERDRLKVEEDTKAVGLRSEG